MADFEGAGIVIAYEHYVARDPLSGDFIVHVCGGRPHVDLSFDIPRSEIEDIPDYEGRQAYLAQKISEHVKLQQGK